MTRKGVCKKKREVEHRQYGKLKSDENDPAFPAEMREITRMKYERRQKKEQFKLISAMGQREREKGE